jgi:hypothetical protein
VRRYIGRHAGKYILGTTAPTGTGVQALPRENPLASSFDSMPRYKVRTSAQAIEKDFPHIVQMIVPRGGFGKKLDDMYEWHWAKDTEAMRGNGWRDDSGRFYVRWCFANLITAQDFARKFGGSIVKGR